MRFGLVVPAIIAATVPAGPTLERLSTPKLTEFVVGFQEEKDGRFIRKLVPKTETNEVWSRMVVDVRLGDLPKSDLPRAQQLSDIVDRHTRNAIRGCPDPQVGPIYSYPIGETEIAKFRIICEKPNGLDKPAVSYSLFILSQHFLHQRVVMFSHMPNARESKWANAIIDATHLCTQNSKAAGC